MIEGTRGRITDFGGLPEFDFAPKCRRPIHPLNDMREFLEAMQIEDGCETWFAPPRLRPDFRLPMDGISDVED